MRIKEPSSKLSENRLLMGVAELDELAAMLERNGTSLLIHTAAGNLGKPELTLFEVDRSYSKGDAVLGRLVKSRSGRWASIP